MALEFMINEKLFPQFKELVNRKDVKKLWLSYGPKGLFVTVNDKELVHVTLDQPKKEEPKPEQKPNPVSAEPGIPPS